MNEQTIEQIYEEHLKKEPRKYDKFYESVGVGIQSDSYIKWKIEKENIELVKSIPMDKRIEALKLLKKGKTCGTVARELGINNHMAVFYLINYNIEDISVLRRVSIIYTHLNPKIALEEFRGKF